MEERIPVAKPKASYDQYRDIISSRINQVLDAGMYVLGKEVETFEEKFARYCGVPYCVAVANGTEALALGLKAVGVNPGDEVITVSHTSVATVAAIEMIGAVPVFVDVDEKSMTMDAYRIEEAMSPKVRAILPVHLYGCPCRISTICTIAYRFGLRVVEDCCQAHGASFDGQRVGSFGDVGAFSFYPTKNLGAFGDAGAVVTKNGTFYQRLLELRQYGWRERQNSIVPGWNSRMDEIQAAVLNVKLVYLDSNNNRRREIASKYLSIINTGKLVPQILEVSEKIDKVWHLFVLRSVVNNRKNVLNYLSSYGVDTSIHYPKPVHLQEAYYKRIRGSENLPNTEKIADQIFTIPLFPEMSQDEIIQVCKALETWSNLPNSSWEVLRKRDEIRLYLGEVPPRPEYCGLVGLTLEDSTCTNIQHDIRDPIPLPDNFVFSIQAEDVFEHLRFNPTLIGIMNELYRVLRPGGLFRLSFPDYGCDVYKDRSVKNADGDIIFDPYGGVDEDGTIGHKWFPRFDNVDYLIRKSRFGDSDIQYLHYYKMDGTAVTNSIDYSKGFVMRTPDFDERVKDPYRPLSLVVDIIKR